MLEQHAEKRIFLPRIALCPSNDEMFPFQFKKNNFDELMLNCVPRKIQKKKYILMNIYDELMIFLRN